MEKILQENTDAILLETEDFLLLEPSTETENWAPKGYVDNFDIFGYGGK